MTDASNPSATSEIQCKIERETIKEKPTNFYLFSFCTVQIKQITAATFSEIDKSPNKIDFRIGQLQKPQMLCLLPYLRRKFARLFDKQTKWINGFVTQRTKESVRRKPFSIVPSIGK